jgi:hypothetical protein
MSVRGGDMGTLCRKEKDRGCADLAPLSPTIASQPGASIRKCAFFYNQIIHMHHHLVTFFSKPSYVETWGHPSSIGSFFFFFCVSRKEEEREKKKRQPCCSPTLL